MRLLIIAPVLALCACATALSDEIERLEAELDRLPRGPSIRTEAPEDLSSGIELETVLRLAREGNPELRESAGRARAGLHAVRRDGALEDPMLRLRSEGIPLRQPTNFRDASENSFGIEQSFPFPGNLGLRSEATLREAESMKEAVRLRERDVDARARRLYFEFYSAGKELETHVEHIRLLEGFERVSEVRFRTGAVSQQDVLRPQVEIVLLQTDVLSAKQRIDSVRASLNQLMGRPANWAIGPPREPAPTRGSYGSLEDLSREASLSHPEVRMTERRVEAARLQLKLADREAVLPGFSLGVEYMQVPDGTDGWTGMLGMNLPWFTGRRNAESRRLREGLGAEEAALEAVRLRIQTEVQDAFVRVEATSKALGLLRDELLPKTNQTVEISRAGYERGQTTFLELLDSERSLRDVRLRYYQTLSMHESALAELERAVGRELRRRP